MDVSLTTTSLAAQEAVSSIAPEPAVPVDDWQWGLQPFTNYTCSVRAATIRGDGPPATVEWDWMNGETWWDCYIMNGGRPVHGSLFTITTVITGRMYSHCRTTSNTGVSCDWWWCIRSPLSVVSLSPSQCGWTTPEHWSGTQWSLQLFWWLAKCSSCTVNCTDHNHTELSGMMYSLIDQLLLLGPSHCCCTPVL